MKPNAPLFVPCDNAVEEDRMKMDVQVQAAAEPLNEGHRPALSLLSPFAPGAGSVAGEHDFDEDAGEGREYVGLERCEQAQLVRQRQNELAHGYVRQHAVDQVGGRVGHAPSSAAGAEAAALAREGHEQIPTARVAMAASEPLSDTPQRKYPRSSRSTYRGRGAAIGLARVRDEGLERLAYHAVEDRLRRLRGW